MLSAFVHPALVIGSTAANLPPLAAASSTADDAAACAAVAFWVVPLTAIGLIKFSLMIYFMVSWVLTDARNRGLDNPATWAVLVGVTNWLGFIIYLCSRPRGNLYPCPGCNKPRLIGSEFCPHCGKPSLA